MEASLCHFQGLCARVATPWDTLGVIADTLAFFHFCFSVGKASLQQTLFLVPLDTCFIAVTKSKAT